jgi:hypothetical protein
VAGVVVAGRRGWFLVAGVSLGCSVAAGAIGVGAGAIGVGAGASMRRTSSPRPEHTYTEWLPLPEVIARAQAWHPHGSRRVPYDQNRLVGGYRTDGSGYASMALGLPAPRPNSADLAWGRFTRQIPASRLRPGDLIINATGGAGIRQVAIFERWANPAHTGYWVYRQRRGYGTDHLVLRFGLRADGDFHPYRPLNVHDPAG